MDRVLERIVKNVKGPVSLDARQKKPVREVRGESTGQAGVLPQGALCGCNKSLR